MTEVGRWMARAWAPAARDRLFGPEQRARMLVGLLVVGVVLSAPVVVVSVAQGMPVAAGLEAVLIAGKLACIGWARRAPGLSARTASAILAFNTVCATASNLLYPGAFRPFTAQLLLAVLFVAWFLPARARSLLLLLLAAGAAATLVGADPFAAEALRVGTLLLTGATIAVVALALRTRHEQLAAQATADPLTGIGNRRAFEERTATALAHARRFDEPLSLVLLDLDGFKQLNDTRGHPAGDAELQTVAQLLTNRARAQDSVFRLGGDEFAVLLPGTDADGAARFSEQLRVVGERRDLQTRMTAGVAQFPEHAADVLALTQAADRALLDGKRFGKHQVRVAEAPARTPR